MFVPDLLHEFELGVWKATFIHLMRILHANGNDSIQKLNKRYAPTSLHPIKPKRSADTERFLRLVVGRSDGLAQTHRV